MERREREIVYSSSVINKIREKDPEMKAIAELWERAFEAEVKIEQTEQGGIRVTLKDERPISNNTSKE